MLAYISAYAFKTGVYMHDNQLIIQEHEVSKLGLGSNNDLKGFSQCTFKYIEKKQFFYFKGFV